jgi:hypothetical protein
MLKKSFQVEGPKVVNVSLNNDKSWVELKRETEFLFGEKCISCLA